MFPFCRPSVVSTVPSQPFIKSSIIIDFSWRIIDYRVFKSKNAKGKGDILGLIGTIIDDCPAKLQNIYSGSDWDLAAYLKYTRVKLAFPFDHLRHLNTTVFNDDHQSHHHRYLLPPSHHLHHQKRNFGRQRLALGVTATLLPSSFAIEL